MATCKYCEKEFDSDTDMHLHWNEEHEEELTSHDREKVKKAEREYEEQQKKKMSRRKKLAGQGLAAAGALIVIALLGYQALGSMGGPTAEGPGVNFDLEGEPMIGSEDANVTIVEFADYKCPFCQQFELRIFPKIKENYIDTGKANFYFINYAFLGDSSTRAAVAGECVVEQDEEQFWNFNKAVYEAQGPESEDWATQETLMNIARENTEGLDYDRLESCISSQETLSDVQSDRKKGSSNGVSSTPTIFVNGKKLSSYQYASVRAAIEQELE